MISCLGCRSQSAVPGERRSRSEPITIVSDSRLQSISSTTAAEGVSELEDREDETAFAVYGWTVVDDRKRNLDPGPGILR